MPDVSFAGFSPAKFRFSNCYFKKITNGFIENTELFKRFQQEVEQGEKRRREIEAKLEQQNKSTLENIKIAHSFSGTTQDIEEVADSEIKKTEKKSDKINFIMSESI